MLVAGDAAQDVADLADEASQFHRLGAELHLARLHLGEVKHVIDELEQVPRAREDVAHVFLLVGVQWPHLAVVHELREPDDGVEGSAQLMGHVREELALQPVGLLHPQVLLLELLVLLEELGFQTLLVGDVAGRGEHPP